MAKIQETLYLCVAMRCFPPLIPIVFPGSNRQWVGCYLLFWGNQCKSGGPQQFVGSLLRQLVLGGVDGR